jgi:hypothetical protein
MSSVVISGDTSGTVTLQAPAVAGNTVLTLPSTSGSIVTASGTATAGGVAYGNGSTAAYSAAGSTNQFLLSNGSSAPSWSNTLVNPTITNYVETPFSANSSTAITLALTNGTVQIITLTGTCTVTMPTAVSGKSFMLLLKTGAGGYTVTWSSVQWPSGTAPTLTSAASKMDKFVFTSDGTYWYGSVAGQNYSA